MAVNVVLCALAWVCVFCHQAVPPKKNFVRGISYLTGYYVMSTGEDKEQLGCQVTYITQSDPRGVFISRVEHFHRLLFQLTMEPVQRAV